MFLRSATLRDHPRIPDLVEAAFGRHDEALLVSDLRRDGAIAIELVATDREELIGHVVMSHLVSPRGCLALAPVSVHPDWQRRGIGGALVRAATEMAAEQGHIAAFVVGNPAWYERFGYETGAAADFDSDWPQEFLSAAVFDDEAFTACPRELVYPHAFSGID